jgi:hypothetical protein
MAWSRSKRRVDCRSVEEELGLAGWKPVSSILDIYRFSASVDESF